ncbi:MAG TPA: hypothetical protein VMV92_39745 [Streptosporangiaceae bacterium]|nr:hypothetical protein [Streptosporangiaceae bacterium]
MIAARPCRPPGLPNKTGITASWSNRRSESADLHSGHTCQFRPPFIRATQTASTRRRGRWSAAYLDVPSSTLATWAYGYERRRPGAGVVAAGPVITARRPAHRHEAAVPFIGLAEAYALTAFRQAGVPMQRIRPAIDALHHELGLQHALASRAAAARRPA